MAGSTPSGRRSRRRSGKRPSSPLTPKNSRSKRRSDGVPRQGGSNASQGPFRGASARPTRDASKARSRRQPARPPQIHPSSNPQTPLGTTSGSKTNRSNTRRVNPSHPIESQGQQGQNLQASHSTFPPQGQAPSKSLARPYSQRSFQGQGSPPTPQLHQAPIANRSLRQPPHPPHESSHSTYPQAPSTYPQAPAAGTGRHSWDIRLGPDVRRRPQLSSNPAFGRTRSTPRYEGGIMVPPIPSQPSLSSPSAASPVPAHPTPTHIQLQVPQSVDALQLGIVEAQGTRPLGQAQPRTQHLHPRPVARRSGSRRNRRRARANPSRAVVVAPSAMPLPSFNSPQARKAVSPWVYGIRLLILGIGLGAIAGTLISALDPSQVSGQTGVEQDLSLVENSDPNVGTSAVGNDARGAQPDGIQNTSGRQPQPSANIISFNAIPKRSPYAALNSQLQTMANNQPELTPGVFALDLESYNYVDLNGSTTFSAASIIKVPILVAFLQDVEQNKIQLDETLVMEEEDVAGGSGNMRLGRIGDQYSALETAKKMIVISDNTATNMLIRRLGGIDHLNRRFRSWGLTATTLRNPLPDLEGTNTTSPAEMTKLMTLISQGKLLETQARDRMLDIMYQTETATLLPAGIGGNAEIAHKTGDIGLMVGDTGLVDTASGRRYAVTIMMRRPHNDSRAQELIRQMAGVIHRELKTPSTSAVPASAQSQSVDSSSGRQTSSADINTSDSSEPDGDRASDD